MLCVKKGFERMNVFHMCLCKDSPNYFLNDPSYVCVCLPLGMCNCLCASSVCVCVYAVSVVSVCDVHTLYPVPAGTYGVAEIGRASCRERV